MLNEKEIEKLSKEMDYAHIYSVLKKMEYYLEVDEQCLSVIKEDIKKLTSFVARNLMNIA